VAHRDLKPENILMADSSDTADLKIVDFGLSKIIGPNETSLDPFGTLVRYFFDISIFIQLILLIVLCCSRSFIAKAIWQRSRPMEFRYHNLLDACQSFAI